MPTFNITIQTRDLYFIHPFTLSRGTREKVQNIFIRLSAEGTEGYGEASPNARYGEEAEDVIQFMQQLPPDFFDEIETGEALAVKLEQTTPAVQSARVAVEMAWLDWKGKKVQCPLWKAWKAPSCIGPVTSFTIGLDTPENMQKKIEEASEYPLYKVKLGSKQDRDIIRSIRQVTDKPIRVDANEGWKTLEEAKEQVRFLADQNIELIEQPMPAAQYEDLVHLKKFSPLPLAADESFTGDEAMDQIARAFDIVNIKLMKTGSMVRARQSAAAAQASGLKVMVGCMIESSVANTAGAILALFADYADLDGHLLIRQDPASGLALTEEKRIAVSEELYGLGIDASGVFR